MSKWDKRKHDEKMGKRRSKGQLQEGRLETKRGKKGVEHISEEGKPQNGGGSKATARTESKGKLHPQEWTKEKKMEDPEKKIKVAKVGTPTMVQTTRESGRGGNRQGGDCRCEKSLLRERKSLCLNRSEGFQETDKRTRKGHDLSKKKKGRVGTEWRGKNIRKKGTGSLSDRYHKIHGIGKKREEKHKKRASAGRVRLESA